MYYIKDYQTVKQPYEGHYLHYGVKVKKELMPIKFYAGDYIVYVNQPFNRYIVETLEPQGIDSFFAWNFFDGILQQKEWFSPFSFEETANGILASDNKLKIIFDKKKAEDEEFAKSRSKQLFFIYKIFLKILEFVLIRDLGLCRGFLIWRVYFFYFFFASRFIR